jgi:5'-nucleotidase
MHVPRRSLPGLVAAGAGLSLAVTMALAPGADSAPAQERTSGTAAAKSYHHLAKKKDYVKLDLLALNDFHGNLQPPTGSSGQIGTTKAGGAAFLASLLNRERGKSRAAGATPLTVAAGDLIGASPLLSAAFHDEPTIKAMNQMHLDVTSVGNHEFDEGVDELLRMQKGGCLPDGNGANGQDSCPGGQSFEGAKFRYLGANVFWKNPAGHARPTPFKPYKIFKVDKQKVAFIGMTLEGTPSIVSASGIASVDFRDEVETANALVPKLRKKGVKSIIVLLHEGVAPADTSAYNSCSGVSGPGLAIAQNLSPAIDAVISGHTHQAYNCVVKDPHGHPRLFTSASSFGRMVTKLHFLIDPKKHDIVRPAAFAENIINANGEGQKQSKKINNLISVFKALVAPVENKVIGHLAGATQVSRAVDNSRTPPPPVLLDGGDDSALGNLIADAQKADPSVVRNGQAPVIALMNPGGIRADLVANANGEVTYGAAFSVQPFNNFVVSMDLTGAQIVDILNQQWNGPNEKTATGNKILQVSGITYRWDVSDADGTGNAIVGSVMLDADGNPATTGDNTPLVPTQTYRVVANNFLSDGGDNFPTFKAGTNKLIGGLDIDSLVTYLQAHDPYPATPGTPPTVTNRISSVP